MSVSSGTRFGPYEIIDLLGSGGMGEVYRARDTRIDRDVAIKVLSQGLAGESQIRERFEREARIVGSLNHPNICTLYDVGEQAGTHYLVMEYIEGETLEQRLKRGPLPLDDVLQFCKQMADALDKAHRKGVVHRDLKPGNIMIMKAGVKLLDFGLAKLKGDAVQHEGHSQAATRVSSEALTVEGTILGTLQYMAPEQLEGKDVDERTDIFAFGAVLYEMLTGKKAFRGSRASLVASILKDDPQLITDLLPTCPPLLHQTILRCLAKNPADRWQTASDLLFQLNSILQSRFGGFDVAGLESQPARVARRFFRPLVVVVLAVLVGVVSLSVYLNMRSVPAVATLEPIPLLIADFENGTGEPVFNGLLEQALAVGIEGASHITSLERTAAADLAHQLQPGTDGLPTPVARLVAVREGAHLVLSGSIEAVGRGFRLTVHALDPLSGQSRFEASADAATKEAVLTAIGDLSREVRELLGDPTLTKGEEATTETFTTASIEAASVYVEAIRLAYGGMHAEAVEKFRTATQLDPDFGRAYSGWATSEFKLGRNEEAKALWDKALSLMSTMTERERLRTLGVYYAGVTRNYDKARETFSKLVSQYPADAAGRNNLAVSAFLTLDFQTAAAEGRRLVDMFPNSQLYRSNLALYAMYSGDFDSAAEEARAVIQKDPKYGTPYVPLAISLLAMGNPETARETYQRMAVSASTSEHGESIATLGLADVAIYRGKFEDARELLRKGIEQDLSLAAMSAAAVKNVALAETSVAEGDSATARLAVNQAVNLSSQDSIKIASAIVRLEIGDVTAASDVANELSGKLQTDSRAYGLMIRAGILRRSGEYVKAIDTLRSALQLANLWRIHYELGRAYLDAGFFAEALDEFQTCLERQGEATAMFLDDTPTFRYLADLRYWIARAQEGLGMRPAAIQNYKSFLELRPDGGLLANDARRRTQ